MSDHASALKNLSQPSKSSLQTIETVIRSDGACRTPLFSDLPSYKNVLLLQGPIGPFFKNLSHYWRNRGATVTKVNFNSGDDKFYPVADESVIQYKSSLEFWPKYLSDLLINKKIKAVFLFGDCRQIHRDVRSLCETLGVDLWVLEEGYIRPHLFTLERKGVNHKSSLTSTSMNIIRNAVESKTEPSIRDHYKSTYWFMVRWSIIYWFTNIVNKSHYPSYTHHRVLDIQMGIYWTRSFFRYWLYRISEKTVRSKLLAGNEKGDCAHSYLLPLQVHDDSQITTHSDFLSIEQVIETVISPFANHLKTSTCKDRLIIKHHPMDRGHKNYKMIIEQLCILYQIKGQVFYIHEISLPALLKKVSGCITVNSTIGIQALHYGVPTINLGRSFYDKPGLTFQGSLEQFWTSNNRVNMADVKSFRNFILHQTQINGSLYDPNYWPK